MPEETTRNNYNKNNITQLRQMRKHFRKKKENKNNRITQHSVNAQNVYAYVSKERVFNNV